MTRNGHTAVIGAQQPVRPVFLVRDLVDRFAPPVRYGQDGAPLLAKRFEQRVAELPPAERTEERLNRLFDEVARAAPR